MSTIAQRRSRAADFATHEVLNQSQPLEGRNLFLDNAPLVEGLEREGGGWARDRATEAGAFWGGEPQQWGELANAHPPVLHTHDRFGRRLDAVEFHPTWHQLMEAGVRWGMHALPWTEPQPGAHVARAAIYMSGMQAEAGFCCPITMTFAAVPALEGTPEVADEWLPRLTAGGYDGALKPAQEKPGAICGMAMTEKQGGSDVRANTTHATPLNGGGQGAEYEIVGHKWFCSAPMSDLFLVLAQTDEGLSCFAVPRFLPDGTRNDGFQLQRLKDKLGNKSNASSEVEFKGAWGRMVGEPGRGVPTIIAMVGHTRLDCVIGSAAGMRAAVAHATWHTAHRSAFGKRLVEQPLMVNVLADLAVESEAATALALRLSRAYDEARTGDERATHFKRLATAVAKYHVCKRAPNHAYEALECFGGNGYVEASGMPRLYREAPLSSIWEGSGNVMALDVLRALARTPEALGVLFEELDAGTGQDTRYDAFVQSVKSEFDHPEDLEHRARRVVERLALGLQGSLLLRHAPEPVADAFVATRIAGDGGVHYGTIPPGVDVGAIVERHLPQDQPA
ncbi:MAG: acyl-CoA dehydrogenase family protein [Solirubrobacterales bacterium]|nr:acyl-CoA dehydrogenase family protein [Solirubrobacterales bacterium]